MLIRYDRCNPGVAAWFDAVADEDLFVSVLTLGEIGRGIERIRRRDADSAARLSVRLEELAAVHADRLVSIARAIADEWGRMSVPDPLPVIDGLLAASARVRGLVLVTRNTREVAGTGVDYVDPFSVRLPAASR